MGFLPDWSFGSLIAELPLHYHNTTTMLRRAGQTLIPTTNSEFQHFDTYLETVHHLPSDMQPFWKWWFVEDADIDIQELGINPSGLSINHIWLIFHWVIQLVTLLDEIILQEDYSLIKIYQQAREAVHEEFGLLPNLYPPQWNVIFLHWWNPRMEMISVLITFGFVGIYKQHISHRLYIHYQI